MQTLDIIAYHRTSFRKSYVRHLRQEGQIPCVIYGGAETLHAAVPAIFFRKLLRSEEAHFVRLNLEGRHIDCVLQDVQYHPVAGHVLHADFWILGKKAIKTNIPLHMKGQPAGLLQGGKLQTKMRKVQVKALAQDMPAKIEVDTSKLELGQFIRVKDLPKGNYKILDNPVLPVVSVQIPKVLRGPTTEEAPVQEEEATEAAQDDPGSNEKQD